MKIKVLLLTAVIAIASATTASADSNHRYKDQRHQSFGHVEYNGHRAVDRNNRLFSFNLVVPGPSYYVPHRSYARQDYRNQYKYRNDHRQQHHQNKHNDRHHNRDNLQGFRGTR